MGEDFPYGPKIAVSSGGTVLVTGTTVALDFLTSSDSVEPHSPEFEAGSNGPGFPIPYGFVMMLNPGEINDGAATATTLTSSNLTQILGVPVTFTAQVSSVGSNVVPTGSVDFWGTNSSDEPFSSQPYYLGTGTLNSSGKASITTPNESFNGVILANYSGSSDSVFSAGIVNQSYSNPGLKYLSGSNQATVYGKPFPNPITVQTTNAAGQAIDAAGIPILFSGSGVSVPNPGVFVNTNSNGTVGVIATPTRAGNLTATASYGSAAMVTFNLLAEKAPLYISARNIAVTYGQTPPQPTAYLLTGFVNGDKASVVSGAPILTTTVTSATPVGVYPIGVQVGTLSAANYYFDSFSSGEGAVYVGRAPLHLSAKNVAITYGQKPPAITGYTLTGFVNGESSSVVSGAPVLTSTVTATTPPGTYPIGVQIGTLSAANYIFETTSSGEGSIQVAKAPLTILPASVTIHVGDPLPTFTYAITGFVNGDTQATATTGAPTLTTTAPNTNTPGHYYIVASAGSLAAKNYTFNAPSTATDGILTILPN